MKKIVMAVLLMGCSAASCENSPYFEEKIAEVAAFSGRTALEELIAGLEVGEPLPPFPQIGASAYEQRDRLERKKKLFCKEEDLSGLIFTERPKFFSLRNFLLMNLLITARTMWNVGVEIRKISSDVERPLAWVKYRTHVQEVMNDGQRRVTLLEIIGEAVKKGCYSAAVALMNRIDGELAKR